MKTPPSHRFPPFGVALLCAAPLLLGPAARGDTKGSGGDRDLTALEARRGGERVAGMRAALAQYADRLGALRAKLLARGDAEAAARVQLEMDRVSPAVAADSSGNTEKDTADVGIFETTPLPPPTGDASGVSDADVEKLVASLAGDTGKPAAEAPSPAAPASPGARLPMRMTAASFVPALASANPPKGHLIWTAGRSASWTVRDLVPGYYRLLLRYGAEEEDGGGTLLVSLGQEKLAVPIAATGGWSRRAELLTDPIVVTASSADLTLRHTPGQGGGTWLFDLQSVTLVPSAGPEKPSDRRSK